MTFRVKKCLLFRNSLVFSFFGLIEQTEYVGTSIFRDLFKKHIFGVFGARKVPGKFLNRSCPISKLSDSILKIRDHAATDPRKMPPKLKAWTHPR